MYEMQCFDPIILMIQYLPKGQKKAKEDCFLFFYYCYLKRYICKSRKKEKY